MNKFKDILLITLIFFLLTPVFSKTINKKYFSIDLPKGYKLIKVKFKPQADFLEEMKYQVIDSLNKNVINIHLVIGGGVEYAYAPLRKYTKKLIENEEYYCLK